MAKKTVKTDYSLSYRYRTRNGVDWSKWHEGHGQFQDFNLVKKQVRSIVEGHKTDIEIKIEKDGNMIDFNGKPITRPLFYEIRR